MTDTYDDLDDLDRVWAQDDPLLARDIEVDFGLDGRPVFDDDPVVDDRPEVLDGLAAYEEAAYEELDDEENVVGLPGRDRFRSGRVSRRKTATLLHASTMTIGVGIGAIGVTLTLVILTGRLLTARQLFFVAHSILGILIVHAFAAGLGTLWTSTDSRVKEVVRKLSTTSMAVLAWLTTVIGTWLVYPGYRAAAPPGADLSLYPRQYLLRAPSLRFWETFAMEWNVHVGWITPFLATAVGFIAVRYGKRLVADLQVRKMLINLFVLAFAAAVLSAVLGALVNVAAPNDFLHRAYHP
jgi:hypothetical protein